MFLAANQAAAALDCADYQRPALVVMVAVQGAEVPIELILCGRSRPSSSTSPSVNKEQWVGEWPRCAI